MQVMRVTAILSALAAAGQVRAQAPYELGGLTLGDVERLSRAELARRLEPVAGTGSRLLAVDITRAGPIFYLVSRARAATPGLCTASLVTLDAAPATNSGWRMDEHVYVAVPPDDWRTAPLRAGSRQERTGFHVLAERVPLSQTGAACANLGSSEGFFEAQNVAAARRAADILIAYRARIADRPDTVLGHCSAMPDCVQQFTATSVNDFDRFEECGDSALPPDLACANFDLRPRYTTWSSTRWSYRLSSMQASNGETHRVVWFSIEHLTFH